jgi:opacity protein-like surface antigen
MSNWSVGLEYKYYDFGKSSAFTTDVLADLAGVNLAPDHIRAQTFTMSVNYRFAPSAIFAR